jgi:hypothetical protein
LKPTHSLSSGHCGLISYVSEAVIASSSIKFQSEEHIPARGLYVGRYPFTTCSVTGLTPTPSPSLLLAQAIFESKLLLYGYPNILKFSHSTPTCQWRWNRQSVPKRRHIKFRRRGITQKKTYNMRNTNLTLILIFFCIYLYFKGL